VFILGVTGSGKSRCALNIAKRTPVHILNCDSIQQIRGLDIGSAKPTLEESNICPHHLFDWVETDREVSVGDFCRAAQDIFLQYPGKNFLCVGGTGFYFQALEYGLFSVPARNREIQERIERRVKEEGELVLHEELKKKDPTAAARIAPRDHYRLVRALEIFEVTGKTKIELLRQTRAKKENSDFILKVGLQVSRPEHREKLRRRIDEMLDRGWLGEVQRLRARYGDHIKSLHSVGYRQVLSHLQGNLRSEDLVEEILKAHSRLAKKQSTWFRRDSEVLWFSDPRLLEDRVVDYFEENTRRGIL
ncbi:MAG: tRNA (adenosine(37)-N6)-dimethylallyltransferase MiaA, partial [Bdellovibrio sp.]